MLRLIYTIYFTTGWWACFCQNSAAMEAVIMQIKTKIAAGIACLFAKMPQRQNSP